MEASFERNRENIQDIYIVRGQNYCQPHYHHHLEILYTMEDGILATVNGINHLLPADSVAVFDSFDVHSYQNPARLNSIALVLPTIFCPDYKKRMVGRKLTSNFITDPEVCAQIFYLLSKLRDRTREDTREGFTVTSHLPQDDLLILGYCTSIMGLVLSVTPTVPIKEKQNSTLIRDILLYIDENYMHGLTLDALADRFGYSKYYFSRLCSKTFAGNLNDYINSVRVYKILSKISEGSLTELSMQHGFSSLRTFQRAFKKIMGCTASDYLRSHTSVSQPRSSANAALSARRPPHGF